MIKNSESQFWNDILFAICRPFVYRLVIKHHRLLSLEYSVHFRLLYRVLL
jgi:hypothetical protein